MKCPQITKWHAIILGILITISLIQVLGGYRLSHIHITRVLKASKDRSRAAPKLTEYKEAPLINGSLETRPTSDDQQPVHSEYYQVPDPHQENSRLPQLTNGDRESKVTYYQILETIKPANQKAPQLVSSDHSTYYQVPHTPSQSNGKAPQLTNGQEPQVTNKYYQMPQRNSAPNLQIELAHTVVHHCPTVHIAMVVSSNTESRFIYFAVKSVLMHRSTKLHFHFITDSRTKTVLNSMLGTWLVPGISHDYYDLENSWTRIRRSFSDSQAHRGCFGTLSVKLNLHLILPDSVKGVTVIEPTSIVNTELWSVIMSCADHMITLCSGRCVSYCHSDSTVLHNNTIEEVLLWGAMALNLHGIRSSPEKNTWTQAVQSVYECRANAVESFYKVMQQSSMGTATRTEHTHSCLENASDFNNSHGQELCKLVQEYDGNMLRYTKIAECTEGMEPIVTKAPSVKKFCDLFTWERQTRRRELPFLLEHSYNSSDEYDVTLANHVDYNRLNLIERSITNWDGPVSLAIQVTESQVQGVVDFILNSEILRERRNISYHLLFRIGPSYPINALRELAHRHVTTPYIFYSDIDLVSSYRMYTTIKQDLKAIGNMNKIAIVIAAFEADETDFKIPHSKSEMVELKLKDKVRQVHRDYFYTGQGRTDYKKWETATKPYSIKWEDMYEPYTLVATSVFSYDPRFVARFHDKGSHNTELHMAGFQYLVLHDCFFVHLPHPVNAQNMGNLQKCSKQWYKDWVKEKRKQYNYTKGDVPPVFFARR